MKQKLIPTLICLLLAGCATYKSSKTFDTTQTGVALRIVSNYRWGIPPLSDLELWIHRKGEPCTGKIHLKKSGDLIYMNIPPGRYYIGRVDLGNYYLILPKDTYFETPPTGMAYIGDLHINKDINLCSIGNEGIQLVDQYEQVQELIRRSYPASPVSKNLIHLDEGEAAKTKKLSAPIENAIITPLL